MAADKFVDMRELQNQHRQGQGQKPKHNKPRPQNQRPRNNAQAKQPAGLIGKKITIFPVYLRNSRNANEVRVVRHFNEVQQLLAQGGQWECLGRAPLDPTRAVLSARADVSFTVTRTFGLFRILEIHGNKVRLFPDGELDTTTTWMDRNRPRVGSWVIRQNLNDIANRDSYIVLNEKAFNSTYAPSMDPTVLDSMNRQYDEVVELMAEKREAEAAEAAEAERLAARAMEEAKAEKEDALAEALDDTADEMPDVEVETIQETAAVIESDEPEVGETQQPVEETQSV